MYSLHLPTVLSLIYMTYFFIAIYLVIKAIKLMSRVFQFLYAVVFFH